MAHQASFDISVLKKTAEYYQLLPLNNSVIDTLRLAKRLYPRETSYQLDHFRVKLGIPAIEAHRASADAYVTCPSF